MNEYLSRKTNHDGDRVLPMNPGRKDDWVQCENNRKQQRPLRDWEIYTGDSSDMPRLTPNY